MRRMSRFVIMTIIILITTCIRCFAQSEFVESGGDILTYNDFDAGSIFDAVPDDIMRELPDGAEEFDAEKIAGDNSLKGEFIRLVLADETIDGEKKQKVISVGLKALSDRELDI